MDQLNLDLEQASNNLIDSNIKTNSFAENTNALAIGLAMSPRNEISDLSHTLLCLADQDFEEYILALRTLRSVSKAFTVIGKVKPMNHDGEKVEIPFEPTKKQRVKRNNTVLLKDKIINFLKEFLKDGPKSSHDCVYSTCQEIYGESIPSMSRTVYIQNCVRNIVNKNNKIWSLK